jgi:large conductance mechanosensitive channel
MIYTHMIKKSHMALENEILEELKKIREAVTSKASPTPEPKGLIAEFKEFIAKAGVLGLAIGFIMGTVIGRAVTALVQDLIMPIPSAFIEGGDWRKAIITIPVGNGMKFGIGDFIGVVIDFIIIAIVIFVIAKFGQKAGLK